MADVYTVMPFLQKRPEGASVRHYGATITDALADLERRWNVTS